MVYKGRLRVASESGDGIPVDLTLDDVFVDLRADGEELGRWRMDVVAVSRLTGNEFALTLDGEQMVFTAADPLGFTYSAVTTIEEIGGRLRKRGSRFRRKRSLPDPVETSAVDEDGPPNLVELLPRDDAIVLPPAAEAPAPAPVTPAAAPAGLAEAVRSTSDPVDLAPISAGSDPGPDLVIDDVGVTDEHEEFPDTTLQMDHLEPLATIDAADVAEHVDEGLFDPAAIDSPESDEGEEDVLGVEQLDVEAVEIERVDPLPQPPLQESPKPQDPTEEPLDGIDQPSGLSESLVSAPVVETYPDPDVPSPPERGPADSPPEAEPGVATARPIDARWSKKRRLLGRNKSNETHEHDYAGSQTVSGITRRVCTICGHVSFAGVESEEGWV